MPRLGLSCALLAVLAATGCASTIPGDSEPEPDAAPFDPPDAGQAAAQVETLATGLMTGSAGTSFNHINLAVDDSAVYLPIFGAAPDYQGRIVRIPLAGGAPVDLATAPSAQFVSLDADNVYFSSYYGGLVGAVPKAGGAVTPLAESLSSPVHTAVAGDVFWAGNGDSKIHKVAATGGTPVTLADSQTTCLALAVDDTNVYFPSWAAGVVRRVPRAGGSPVDLSTGQVSPDNFWVDGTELYFRTASGTAIAHVHTTGGATATIVSGTALLSGPVTDATNVYWADQGSGMIMGQPKVGGASFVVAMNQPEPFALTFHGGYLYWITEQTQTAQGVHRVAVAPAS